MWTCKKCFNMRPLASESQSNDALYTVIEIIWKIIFNINQPLAIGPIKKQTT